MSTHYKQYFWKKFWNLKFIQPYIFSCSEMAKMTHERWEKEEF